jgi:ribonuclease R
VPQAEYPKFRDMLKNLAAEGRLAKYRHNQFGSIRQARTVVGELHVKTQGYGFCLTDEGEDDVFISQKNMGTALHKDIVKVQLYARPKGRSPEGRVVEVVKRNRQNIVGTYRRSRRFGFVVPDNLKILRDIYIADADSLGAKPGQKVVAEIISWEDEHLNPEGRIVEVLGYPDDPGVDVISVAKAFDLPTSFPVKVEEAASKIPATIPLRELDRRLDLRDEMVFTIDPEDAKDFDDAVSIRRLENQNFELGVHIADVSYYVQEGSVIDKEALRRGTSVYLVDRVVPMLPERLSNELCSLRPNEDRLTMSCIMEVDPQGQVVRYELRESIIQSKRRFTYEEVQQILDDSDSKDPFAPTLRQMLELSRILRRRREQIGSLDFDTPEVKIVLDEGGFPVDIMPKERLDSMQMIEEFMLLANQTVARHIDIGMRQDGHKPAFIYRIHERPDDKKMAEFQAFVRALGRPFKASSKRLTTKMLRRYLGSLRGTPEQLLVEKVMLRSMMKARYSVKNEGHFGLAFRHYTHFTSPIRRYPDLVVHRLLKQYKDGFDPAEAASLRNRLTVVAEHASDREVVAQEAERESLKLKTVEFMERHLGDTFSGLISGVVPFGVFVEIPEYQAEGLVHISEIDDDYYIYDEQNYSLIGQSTGKVYRLGDSIRVRVARVDRDERLIDFELVRD